MPIKSAIKPNRLDQEVYISRQFLRSVRLDTDIGREDALTGYVCQRTARYLLENMAEQILNTKQRAFTWTGPYGGGKSSLALMLCSLVGKTSLRLRAREILDLPESSPVLECFAAEDDGWEVIPIVGSRTGIHETLVSKVLGSNTKKRFSAGELATKIAAKAENHAQGVLLIIDELGKFLEATAQSPENDIYIFQELAEAASRTSGKLVIVGILHQSFEAYANRLNTEVRDEWAKIQGRYVDIPLVTATDEMVELIGKAISTRDGYEKDDISILSQLVGSSIRQRRPGTASGIEIGLSRCWPLHPATAAILGPISKRKFGQNERSTFGFLSSREPLGFSEYLHGTANRKELYTPAMYWDYLRANLEPAILASPDGHKWATGVDAVERAESKGKKIHVDIAKTVALLEMFRTGSGLAAEAQIIINSMNGSGEEEVLSSLTDLISWRILVERRHLGAFGVYAGSDFDIEAAIAIAKTKNSPDIVKQAVQLANLQPVLAKRFYAEKGAMHWLDRRIVLLSDISLGQELAPQSKNSIGEFVLCLTEEPKNSESVVHSLTKASRENYKSNMLLGVPDNSGRITALSLELIAAEQVSGNSSELEGDSVARRELAARISSLRSALEDELSEAFLSSDWFWNGTIIKSRKTRSLSAIASKICDEVYPQSPVIHSELVNRDTPSSNSVRARKDLMYRMIAFEQQQDLAYEGFPADAGLYYTVIQANGLHRYTYPNGWRFAAPDKGDRGMAMQDLWNATQTKVFKKSKTILLSDLYSFWALPPYGVKNGVMPLLALAFFLSNRAELALYVSGLFTPDLTETVIDEWLLDPNSIKLRYIPASRDQSKTLEELARMLSGRLSTHITAEPLSVARAMVRFGSELPGWAKRTTSVSKQAQAVRSLLLRANDPHKLIYADLPTILNTDEETSLPAAFETVMTEIWRSYSEMLDRVRSSLLSSIDQNDGDAQRLISRASAVKGSSGDFRLDAFTSRIETFDNSDRCIEGFISLAVSKPAAAWVDRDIDMANVQLGTWSMDFRKLETLVPMNGKGKSRHMIGVVFSTKHGGDINDSVDISDADAPVVNHLVRQILELSKDFNSNIAIAALAEVGAKIVKEKMGKINND
jgi:hypothetical protein